MKVNQSKLVIVVFLVLTISLIVFGFASNLLSRSLTSKEFIVWANNEENGLVKFNTIENYKYRCQYLPLEYFMARYPKLKYSENEKSKYNNTISFVLDFIPLNSDEAILSPDIIGHELYSERLYYLNSLARKDFKLVYNSDTLECINLNYENPFSLNRNLKVMIDFESQFNSIEDDFTLIYNDNLLGGGILKFHFEGSNLSTIPKLKTI